MVMEAVAMKIRKEDAEQHKEQQRKDFRSTKNKSNFSNLDQYR